MAFLRLCSVLLTRGWIGRGFDGGAGHVHSWIGSIGVSVAVDLQVLNWGGRVFGDDHTEDYVIQASFSIRFLLSSY